MWEYVRAVRDLQPRWLLWENVPGCLSTRDDAFGCLLDALQDCGYVNLAWRVLDAQFFPGIPQRRRRVFLVGHIGEGGSSAAVLFESEGMRGDNPSSREKREALARAAGRGAASEGFKYDQGSAAGGLGNRPEQSPTLTANGKSPAVIRTAGHSARLHQCAPATAFKIRGGAPTYVDREGKVRTAGKGALASEELAFTVAATQDQHILCEAGGRDAPICMSNGNAHAAIDVDMAGTLTVGGDTPFVCGRSEAQASNGEDIVGALCARDYKGVGSQFVSEGKVICQPDTSGSDMCFAEDQRGEVRLKGGDGSVSGAVAAHVGSKGQGVPYVASSVGGQRDEEPADGVEISDGSRWIVRRLTPLECERLQGFPDGWTDVPFRGKEHPADGPRYKAIGNSMAVPCMRWLGERIALVDAEMSGA